MFALRYRGFPVFAQHQVHTTNWRATTAPFDA
jgi:hypothetical protein